MICYQLICVIYSITMICYQLMFDIYSITMICYKLMCVIYSITMIEDLNRAGPQTPGTRLFSLDAQSMYPSIPTIRGPDMVRKRCLEAGMRAELVEWLVRAVRLLLKSNTFEYDSNL